MPHSKFMARLLLSVVMQVAVWGGLLFIPAFLLVSAAALQWWRAWTFLVASAVATIVTMLAVFPGREDLLEERFKSPVQKGQPLADRIVLLSFLVAFFAVVALIPLDVFRLRLLPTPSVFVSLLGLALFLLGWLLMALALRDNAFAAPVVRHQTERHHAVADTGVYAVIRHPMYAGLLPLVLGAALWLQSYAAAWLATVPIALIVVRIAIEERFLKQALQGYEAYTHKVRYRLIPGVW
jgi:protein-S-isoprenylcysteine O-methyltransferase Ste14